MKILYRLAIVAIITGMLSCGRESDRLNVMIIAVDTLRPDHLGCYGYECDTSPNIDRFAAEGVLCTNAVSQSPWTTPSFATVFTSLYPTQHGATTVHSHMRSSFPTLATILKAEGYATGAIINAPALKPAYRVNRGFDYYHMTPSKGRLADGTTKDALAWIDHIENQPFFMFVHYFDPHLSYSPPSPYDELFDSNYQGRIGNSFNLEGFSRIRSEMFEQMKVLTSSDWNHIISLYDGEIAFTDSAIGSLLRGLEQRDLRKNTLIVFLSDHGEEFYEHGGFEHAHSLFDELIRVPLIFSLPDALPQNVRLTQQVRLLDVMPTILDLVGIMPQAHFEGVSLKPLLRGQGRPPSPGPTLLPQHVAYAEAVRHTREKKSVTAYPWKLIYETGTGEEMLFNLEHDPGEKHDLSTEEPESLASLEQELFRALFNISDTWYVELAGGGENHTFDLEITAEREPLIGRIHPYRLLDEEGHLLDGDQVMFTNASGSVLKIDGLNLKGKLTLAFKVDPERIPLKFDLRIDGRPAVGETFLGESLVNPDEVPFIVKAARAKVRSKERPVSKPDMPYLLVWYSETEYRSDTTMKLDEETKKELRALGYIQ